MTSTATTTTTTTTTTRQRFSLGRLVATPGALEALGSAGVSPLSLLQRHVVGDWGQVSAADAKTNDRAVDAGERILSAYELPNGGPMIWVITEADRSSTCILLPTEY